MLISIKQKNYTYGEHFEKKECGTLEYVISTNEIKTVRISSDCDLALINETFSIKKETWLEIKKALHIDEFDETKG